jgi:ketosteroid isomerase-like protein
MRLYLTLTLFVVTTSTCVAADNVNIKSLLESKARAILEVGNFREATNKKLVDSLESVMHPDCLIVDPNGKTFSKAEELSLVRQQSLQFTGKGEGSDFSLKVQQVDVRTFGSDTAVVTGRSVVHGKFRGQDVSGNYRFTQVYKLGNRGAQEGQAGAETWQMITCLATRAQ